MIAFIFTVLLLIATIGGLFTFFEICILRLFFKMENSKYIKLLKILPHLSDTLLIVSGVVILYLFAFDIEWWLIAKFALLILYIVFAAKFFSKKVSQPKSIFFWLACVSFIGAMLIAYLK